MRTGAKDSAAPEKAWRGPRPAKGFPNGVHFPSDYNRAMIVVGKSSLREQGIRETDEMYRLRLADEVRWLRRPNGGQGKHG